MNKIKHWVRPAVQEMKAYHIADASGMIKLDAMENPYIWPDQLRQQWLAELKEIAVNRYPDTYAVTLQERLRETMSIPDDMSIILGNGSDELIQIIAMTMAQTDSVYLAPEPSFVMYQAIAEMVNVRFVGVPLDEDKFSLDRDAILAAIDKHQPAIVFLAYPNNPTGNLFDENIIVDVIQAAPGIVVLDEAYHAFSRKSFMSRLGEFDNLLVMRTLSKSGLAGLRLGFLVGPDDWLTELDKLRLPYNINSLSQKTAEFILSQKDVLDGQAQKICLSRDALRSQLSDIDGIKVWPSVANFILFRSTTKQANDIYQGLKQQGVLIKNLHGSHPVLDQCLRVTVGTGDENTKFLAALKGQF